MGRIVFDCPTTGIVVDTGLVMGEEAWESATLTNNTYGPCPHCGATHKWSSDNAYLAE